MARLLRRVFTLICLASCVAGCPGPSVTPDGGRGPIDGGSDGGNSAPDGGADGGAGGGSDGGFDGGSTATDGGSDSGTDAGSDSGTLSVDGGSDGGPAGPDAGAHLLTVVVGGDGGSVVSTPPGLSCSTGICIAPFDAGTDVTLNADAGAGYAFAGWGGVCSGGGACLVTMTADQTVTAAFVQTFALTVTVSGTGTVTSTPPGIACTSGSCLARFSAGQVVSLGEVPGANQTFSYWGGDCSGGGTCGVAMTMDHSVSATFGQVASLSFTGPPANGTVDHLLATTTSSPIQVTALDTQGAVVSGGGNVVLTVASGPGTLGGTSAKSNLGVTSFSDLALSAPGTYQLQASLQGKTTLTPPFTLRYAWSDLGLVGDGQATQTVASSGTIILAAVPGIGMQRSVDTGVTWTLVDSLLALGGTDIASIAIDSSNSNLAYAASPGSGVFQSSDQGATWSLANTGLASASAGAVAVVAGTPSTVVAATASGIYSSPSAAPMTWSLRNANAFTREHLAVASDQTTVFVTHARNNVNDGIWRSLDRGTSWSQVEASLLPNAVVAGVGAVAGWAYEALSDGTLRVSHDNGTSWAPFSSGVGTPMTALRVDPTGQSLYGGTSVGLVKGPADAGNGWVNAAPGVLDFSTVGDIAFGTKLIVTGGTTSVFLNDVANAGVFSVATSAPARAVAIGDAGMVAVNTDLGVFLRPATGSAWTSLPARPVLSPSTASAIALDGAGNLVAAYASPGGLYTSAGGSSLTKSVTPPSSSVASLALDQTTGDVYAGTGNRVWVSHDHGATFSMLAAGFPSQPVRSVALGTGSGGARMLYAATDATGASGLYVTSDFVTHSWAPVGTFVGQPVTGLAVAPDDLNTVYACTDSGLLLLATGPAYSITNLSLPGACSEVAAAPNFVAYALTPGALLKTPNASLANPVWLTVSGPTFGFPPYSPGLFSLGIDPANPSHLVVGSRFGVYGSSTGGE